MSIKSLHCQITKRWDGRVLTVIDENGAEYRFAADGESQPAAAVWARGDQITFRKLDLKSQYAWHGTRNSRHDSGMFRIVQ